MSRFRFALVPPAHAANRRREPGRTFPPRASVAALAVGIVLLIAGCTSGSDPRSGPAADDRRATAGPAGAALRSADAPSRVTPGGAGPRDAFVLLSGGGTPLSNNYSQYLQARAIAEFFERECPPGRSWVFFGAGNRPDSPPLIADVRREMKRDGLIVESWLPGPLPRNRPATKENFLRALREEILPVVRSGGTLFLFVGDHGELTGPRDRRESAITLWQMKKSRRRSGDWYTDDKEVLGVAELRQVLAEGLGQGRVLFGMTQCHSGGFHGLGVAAEMSPPREWFVGSPPSWARTGGSGLRLAVAGYTATDQESPAAGCDADPDPDRWSGYERFLPEALLGFDLMTGQLKDTGVRTLAEAHVRATLVDRTIDKPRATSEHYLEAWAQLIESRLARELRITPEARLALQAFERVLDRGVVVAQDRPLREREEQFARFTRQLATELPAAGPLLLQGDRHALETALRARDERGPARGRRGSLAETRRAWSETLRPAWKAAVLAGQADGRLGAAAEFERRLLKLEDDGRDFLFPRGGGADALRNEIFWHSTYAEPAAFDRTTADAVTRWGASRRAGIVAWGRESPDAGVRRAAEQVGPGPALAGEAPRPLTRRTAIERVIFYRRVLAAWEFLVVMKANAALAELEALMALERQPMRAPPVAGRLP